MSTTRFLSDGEIWSTIGGLIQGANKVKVATAYLGWVVNEKKLFDLKQGDILVVALSPGNAKDGLIDPAAVSYFLDKGVKVYAVEKLHAKVYLCDDAIVIGSNNASRRSMKRGLLEAAIFTDETSAVRDAEDFIDSLCEFAVNEAYLSLCFEAYVRPIREERTLATYPRVWVVNTSKSSMSEAEKQVRDTGERAVNLLLKYSKNKSVRSIKYSAGDSIVKRAKQGDAVVELYRLDNETVVYQPAFVISTHQDEFTQVAFLYLQTTANPLIKKWIDVEERLIEAGIVNNRTKQISQFLQPFTEKAKQVALLSLFDK